tara:strand:+ start:460 stop:750 length:291 start_codon:yes stop_codon:yes gene_type:complete
MSDYEYIKVEKGAWNLLNETLWMDTESSIFDFDLREELKEALEEIQYIDKPLNLTNEEIKLLSTMVKEEIEIASMCEAENISSKLNFLFLKLMVKK